MIRLLLEDVTLKRDQQVTAQIRFKGGAHRTLSLPLPLKSWQRWVTPATVIEQIDELLNHHTVLQIADILKELVASLGHEWIYASTLEEVRAAVAAGGYCYVLLDMQIPPDATSRASVGCGETALRLIRRAAPARNAGDQHVLPVLVVTGY